MQFCDKAIVRENVQAIVFDFDNVIVRNSEDCKNDAWSKIFLPHTIEYQKIKEAQVLFSHGKGDRFDMLGYALGVPSHENPRLSAEVIAHAELYNAVVQKCIVQIGIAQSDLDALFSLKEKFPLYIISATPEHALHETLVSLSELYHVELLKLFDLVLGTPKNKVENFQKIHDHSAIVFSNMLMVGDGRNDYAAAKDVGSSFVGVVTKENEDIWSTASFTTITAIDKLPMLLGNVLDSNREE